MPSKIFRRLLDVQARKDPGTTNPFPVFLILSHMNIEALFQFLPFLEKEISAPFSEGALISMWKNLRLLFAVINIIKMIFVIKLRFHEGRRSPVIIWLCPWFSSICLLALILLICGFVFFQRVNRKLYRDKRHLFSWQVKKYLWNQKLLVSWSYFWTTNVFIL